MSRIVKSSSELKNMPAYRLEYEEHVPDCNGQGMVFRHIKSGARVCVISNDDENKVFSIFFRTTPTDDTGVPHIIEHSVLCGSEKFPPKDPFMELAKGSLNTFLNAFTFPDKTGYPVASCNDQDFANLMDVYMDAVLHPNIYRHEEIFKQEGWHYELASADEPITLNGVVYSEMKGAFSSPEDKQQRQIFSALFPNTTYGVESGGDPKFIPDLTYEQFLDFHRRYYHPTNSYIYLYGNMDIEERLEWLDSAYLNSYEVQPVDSEVTVQAPIGTKEIHDFYPLGEEDPEENAGYLSWAFTFGTYDETVKCEAMGILCDVLFNLPGAPVKEALIKAGIGQDIGAGVMKDLRQPSVFVTARNTEADRLADMKRIIREELTRLAGGELNHKSLLAAVNGSEFHYCEADFGYMPKGLEYSILAMNTWLYDDAGALTSLHKKEVYPVLRDKIEEGYYEQLIRDYMLGSSSEVYHALAPKRGLGAEEEERLAKKLADKKAAMSAAEIEALIADTAALKAYQAEPSTAEELETIPLLKREDIERQAMDIDIRERSVSSVMTYSHDIETNGIVYFRMLFDVDRVPEAELPYLSTATQLVGNMNTSKHSYLELNNEINIYTGGITTDLTCYAIRTEDDSYRPMLSVDGRAMAHSFDRLIEFTAEELFDTDFDDLTRIREVLGEYKARMQYVMPAAGNRTAIGRAKSCIRSMDRYKELVGGIEYYRFVCRLLELDDEGLKAAAGRCRAALFSVLGRDNVMLDFTCCEALYADAAAKTAGILDRLGEVRNGDISGSRRGITFDHEPANEGFKTAGEVNFLSLAGRFAPISDAQSGQLTVVQNILSTEYLWNNVRVLGGAYGAGFNFDARDCTGYFYSYRDPHLNETLAIYRGAVDFLKDFTADERTMTKFVIGTMGGVDTPISPSAKGARALTRKLCGTTLEMLQRTRDAILDVTPEDIAATADIVAQIVAEDNICAVGSESSINKCPEMFKEVKNLL